ncbi:cytochrome P450 [Ganoderma sinense ZZ0214-1]|uniref:Cytochrome P450 n=1 Tax=Ganoderma sinense ZZ0214-1 TaxID=1077348 RepID=A0A2G8SLA0_9APHY|nr:cytochrome P450 [Ganoderma sinense ZZ0214-1]
MMIVLVSPREAAELFITVIVIVAISWRIFARRRWNLPPGPKTLPVAGNVFQVSRGYEWLQYARWGKEYGPIFCLSFFGERVIVLNSQQAAADILEKNMNIYSDRPRNMVMASELIGWNRALALNSGGPQHRKFRRLLNKSLNAAAVHDYRSLQEESALDLVRLLLEAPQDFLKHIRTTVGRSIIGISYGHDIQVKGQDYISYAEGVHDVFGLAAKPYAFLVDQLPFLRHLPSWLPGLGFKRQAVQWRKDLDELAQIPFDTVKADIANGDAPDSYVAAQLRAQKAKPNADTREDDIMWTAASLYTGGSDTTIAGLTAFFLLMCLHPEAQKRAQEEIDKVVGSDRLPSFVEMPNLPYVSACVKETLRYWTVAPLGLPHRAMEHGRYQEYDIPAGSTVVANIWGIMHDEAVYSDPLTFKPERFLPRSAGGLGEPDCAPAVFGYGRRICPGMHLAEASLWMYAARILAVLDIKPVRGEDGMEVPPREEPGAGVIW